MPKPRKSVADRNTAIDYLNRDIVNIKTDIAMLNKLVRDGNGQPSLLQQVATMRSEISHFEAEMRESIHELKETINSHHAQTIQKDRLSWQFKSAIFVALISSVTSIVIHYIK